MENLDLVALQELDRVLNTKDLKQCVFFALLIVFFSYTTKTNKTQPNENS